MKRAAIIFAFGLLAFLSGAGCNPWKSSLISEKDFQAVVDDIGSVQSVFRSLTPDSEGKRLAYVRADEQGRTLYVLNLEAMQTQRIQTANELAAVYGWSPDGRYLAFSEFAPGFTDVARSKGEPWRESWLSILERDQTNYQRVTTNTLRVEGSLSSVCWLTTNTFLFSSAPILKDYTEFFVMNWETKERQKVLNKFGDFAVMSPTNLACLWQNNVCTSEVDAAKYPAIQPVTHFRQDEFGSLKWLRYSQSTQKFMFCGTPAEANWRYAYELEPKQSRPVRLTDEDSYNGQWIEGGKGFAYVANRNNHFSLSVNPVNSDDKTNLFSNGAVISYMASADGKRIFATASEGMEPQGIWKYNLENRSLTRVVAGTVRAFQELKIVEPLELKVKSPDGTEIPVFIFKPAFNAGVKHPVIFNLPPPSSQFQRRFEENSQMFANLGFYYVSVNYRGCDGYGKQFAAMKDSAGGVEDIMAARDYLIKNEPVDASKMILRSSSGGDVAVFELIKNKPGLWAGAILDHPGRAVEIDSSFPPMLVIASDQDRFYPAATNIFNRGKAADVDVRLLVYTNETHSIYKTGLQNDLYRKAGKFCLDLAK